MLILLKLDIIKRERAYRRSSGQIKLYRSRPDARGRRFPACCGGEVEFNVVETRIGKVVIGGNKYFDEGDIRASLAQATGLSVPG